MDNKKLFGKEKVYFDTKKELTSVFKT